MANWYEGWLGYKLGAGAMQQYGFGATGGGSTEGQEPERPRLLGTRGGIRAKLIPLDGQVEFEVNSAEALNLALRSAGALPTFTAVVCEPSGLRSDENARVDRFTIGQAMEEALKASFDWVGLGMPTIAAVTTAPVIIEEPWEWHHTAVTIGGACYWVQSWQLEGANNLSRRSDLCGSVAGLRRYYKRARIGDEDLSLTVTQEQPLPDAVSGHLDDDFKRDIAFQATYTRGTKSLTFSLAGMTASVRQVQLDTGDEPVQYEVQYYLPLNAGGMNSALTITEA